MTAIATAMRTAVDAALRADTGVVAAFAPSAVRLHDLAPPMEPRFPYVLIRVEVIGDDTECADGAEVGVTLEVFAREGTLALSVAKVEAIAGAARKALTRQLPLTGHVVDDWLFEGDRPISDPDVLTAHRSLSLSYLTTASA